MRRRKRLKKIFILPPVLLAALLIWLVISQRANSRPEAGFMDDVPVEHFLASDREPDSGLQDSFRLPAGKDGGENLEGLPDRIMSSGICPAPVIRESCPCCSAAISICRITF